MASHKDRRDTDTSSTDSLRGFFGPGAAETQGWIYVWESHDKAAPEFASGLMLERVFNVAVPCIAPTRCRNDEKIF